MTPIVKSPRWLKTIERILQATYKILTPLKLLPVQLDHSSTSSR